MLCLGTVFQGINPAWCSLGFLYLWLGIDINFGKFSAVLASSVSSLPTLFCLLLAFPLQICATFGSCRVVHGYSVLFLSIFFSLCLFSFESFYCISSSPETLSSGMSGLLMSPPNILFIPTTVVVLISSICYVFFLRFSSSLLTLPIRSCMLCTFSTRVFSVLIIVILICCCDHSTIPAISESDSDPCSVTSDCVFFLAFSYAL